MWWWKKKRLNKFIASLRLSGFDVTKDSKATLEVGCRFSNNDMRITDTIENLYETYTMLLNSLNLSREEFKKGKDGGVIVVLFANDACFNFELKKTNAYKAYLKRCLKRFARAELGDE